VGAGSTSLISNAAIQKVVESIELLSEEDWDRVIDVNLKGSFLVSRAAIPHMKRQGGGVILFTGSEMASSPTRPSRSTSPRRAASNADEGDGDQPHQATSG
jgi:NAD(P)-dependent dehydrogenase (short-subunit alcohol dehydrogenase family)